MPVPTGSWRPDAADLAALGTAGRVLVEALLSRYDFAAVEGCVLLEAGHAADALAAVRGGAARHHRAAARDAMVEALRGAARATTCGAYVKLKTNSQAPPLSRDTTAVLLGGWCAVAPPTVTDDPQHVEHQFLTLYAVGGIARLWLQHEKWLRAQAAEWGWSPQFTHDGTQMFYGERAVLTGEDG
jgi:hypothetical protein